MSEQELEDPLLAAVRKARPAIDEAALSPTSAGAIRVLERVLRGEDPVMSSGVNVERGQPGVARRRVPAIRRILRPRIAAIAAAAAAAVAAAVIALIGVAGAPSLADRAYAAINASDQVLHEVDIRDNPHAPGYYDRVEGWLLPANDQTRLIDISGYKGSPYVTVSEWLITATGRVFTRACLSGCRSKDISSFVDGRSGWTSGGRIAAGSSIELPATLPGTFARWFQAGYRARAIVADGTATFDGKHVARFQSMAPTFGPTMVFWRPGTPAPLAVRNHRIGPQPYLLFDWYVDPATARPVGFESRPCASEEVRSCEGPPFTTRIVTFQRLDPTPQNLAQLTGPNAPLDVR